MIQDQRAVYLKASPMYELFISINVVFNHRFSRLAPVRCPANTHFYSHDGGAPSNFDGMIHLYF